MIKVFITWSDTLIAVNDPVLNKNVVLHLFDCDVLWLRFTVRVLASGFLVSIATC